jgi:hypothetical protein
MFEERHRQCLITVFHDIPNSYKRVQGSIFLGVIVDEEATVTDPCREGFDCCGRKRIGF